MSFSIGCDPEFFLKKNQKYISAIGMIGGTKEQPRPLARKGCAVQEDNVSVEFNIPACDDIISFKDNIKYVLDTMKRRLRGFEFSTESAVYFEQDQLQHPKALEFGCEPDFNAWTKGINPRPCATDATLRSAGGHVHVGTKEDPIEVIRAMDLFLGVPSTKLDTGTLRRQLYGKAGAFRPKDYGCEYRTLSNFWIFSEELIDWVYQQTQRAIEFVEEGSVIDPKHGAMIQACINNSDKDAYDQLCKAYGLSY
jgi:hypothetical protein